MDGFYPYVERGRAKSTRRRNFFVWAHDPRPTARTLPRDLPRLAPLVCTEREGFEPSNEVNPRYAISSRARSTAPAPLHRWRAARAHPALDVRCARTLWPPRADRWK